MAWSTSMLPSDNGYRLQRHLIALRLHPEADRLAVVLLLQVCLVQAELGDEALVRDALHLLSHTLARLDVLGVDALVVVGLRLLRERDHVGIARHARPGLLVLEHELRRRRALLAEVVVARLRAAEQEVGRA